MNCAAIAAYVGWSIGGTHAGLTDEIFNHYIFEALVLLPALACFLRAVAIPTDRVAWALIGAGIFSWFLGDVYWTQALADRETIPFPTFSDLGSLAFYPFVVAGLILILRQRLNEMPGALWLQGAIVALSIAAIDAAIVFQPVVETASGSTVAVATTLAYPLADLALLALVVAAWALVGRRLGKRWNLLAIAIAMLVLADSFYLVGIADGTYVEGTWKDALWPCAMGLIAFVATRAEPPVTQTVFDRRWLIIPTGVCALSSIALLSWDHFERLGTLSVSLATVAGAATVVQMGLLFRDNTKLVERGRITSYTDAGAGMLNRNALLRDLSQIGSSATHDEPAALIVFALDGFKPYNDKFGRIAGDVLLKRLGEKLAVAMNGVGVAYRLSEHEFGVIAQVDGKGAEHIARVAETVLIERGDGFDISASHGVAMVPSETRDPHEALKIADHRIYAMKYTEQTLSSHDGEGLIRLLQVTSLSLDTRAAEAAALTCATAEAIGMREDQIDDTLRAFELRNVGNCAIPEEILNKNGHLTEAEWAIVRAHPIVGERILSAVPALHPIAEIVRHHHERADGRGYPDGLVADQIPLGARIVSVVAAYDAMISRRPFRAPLSRRGAIERLRSGAGTQFDPHVVKVFSKIVLEQIEKLEALPTRIIRDRAPRRGGDGSTIPTNLTSLISPRNQ